MKNPIIMAVIGLITNVFSLIMFDFRLFLMSFIYMIFVSFVYCSLCPIKIHYFMLFSTSLFFMFFNYYLAGIWNFMQLDDVYDKPWANSFLYFKKWFLRFVGFIICIFLVILFIKTGGSFIKIAFKISAVALLFPPALLLYEYLENIIINALYGLFKLPVNS